MRFEVQMEMLVKPESVEDPPQLFRRYVRGLTSYYVDDQLVTPEEYRRLYEQEQKAQSAKDSQA